MEAIQMSFHWQMDKQTVVPPCSEVPLGNKEKSATGMSTIGIVSSVLCTVKEARLRRLHTVDFIYVLEKAKL